MHKLRTIHLFAGAGGGILGDLLLGHRPVCAVEINPYRQKVLQARQKDGILPWFPIFSDVTKFNGKPWKGKVEVVAGGFPCQNISVAGEGEGIEGTKSGLWKEMARVICEAEPYYVLLENSPALLNRGLGKVLSDLAIMGYNARWGVFRASDIGSHHKRERLWLFAYPTKDRWKIAELQKKFIYSEPQHSELDRILRTTRKMHDSRNGRDFNEMAGTLDRFEAVGDGQVPGVVALAWCVLSGNLR